MHNNLDISLEVVSLLSAVQCFSEDGSKDRYAQKYLIWAQKPENLGRSLYDYAFLRFAEITGEEYSNKKPVEEGGLFTSEEIISMLKED